MTSSESAVSVNGDAGAGEKPPAPSTIPKAALWIGVAAGASGVAAIVTFFMVRSAMRRRAPDPTSERIQALIDEANRLLRALDDKKHG